MYFSQDKTHFTLTSKSPTTSNMSCHTTTLEIVDTLILSLMLVPKETHANTFKPFLDILSAVEVQLSWSFWSSSFNQVLLLSNYNTSNPNPTHIFQHSWKSNNLTSLHCQKTYLHFLSLQHIYSSSHHLLVSPKSSCQSFCRNMIHKAHE